MIVYVCLKERDAWGIIERKKWPSDLPGFEPAKLYVYTTSWSGMVDRVGSLRELGKQPNGARSVCSGRWGVSVGENTVWSSCVRTPFTADCHWKLGRKSIRPLRKRSPLRILARGARACVCVCHNEKKGARRMASTTSDTGDTSSKQQQAQCKENYNKSKRPVSSVDHCHPYRRKKRREAVY